MVAVPLQVALPLPAVALVGTAVAPVPRSANNRLAPPAMVLRPVRATVARALLPLLKAVRLQVWPTVPVAVMPEV